MRKKFNFLMLPAIGFFLVVSFIGFCEILREYQADATVSMTQSHGHVYDSLREPQNPVEWELRMYRCPLSDRVAQLNDRIIYVGSKNLIRRPVAAIWSRAVASCIFPAAVVLDGVDAVAKAAGEGAFALWEDDPKHSDLMWSYFGRSKKCLYGALASPLGLFSPDFVTQHFLHIPPKSYVEPYGKLYASSALALYPKSKEDVQKIVLEAKKEGKKIAIGGAFMSQGRQALPPKESDLILNLSKMNSVVIHPESKSATVGPGATWEDVQNKANEHALAVKVMQASNIFSVGGSLSINCHGWDHRSGTLKNTVKSIKIVNSEGDCLKLTPSDELFHYFAGGLGGFGVIVEIELTLTENSSLLAKGEVVSPENYSDYFSQEIETNRSIDMHYYRLSLDPKHLLQSGVAVNYVRQGEKGKVADLKTEPERGYKADRIELQIVRRLSGLKKKAWEMEKKSALIESVTTRNEVMRPPIKAIFNGSQNDVEWLQEYFVPKHELADFLTFLSGCLTENKVSLFNASVRYVEQTPSQGFSYAQESDMFAVVLFFNQSLKPEEISKTRAWTRQVIDYVNDHGGTYYLPYHQFATLEQFRKSYPNWKRVLGDVFKFRMTEFEIIFP